MNDISFQSTFRIQISQPGINKAKKNRLKSLIESYPNGLIGNSNTGHARISIPNENDTAFISKLKNIGYKIYQKFEGENISKENLDNYIKDCLNKRDYSQIGKQKAAINNKKIKSTFYEYPELKETKNIKPNVTNNTENLSIEKINSNDLEKIQLCNQDNTNITLQDKIRNSTAYKKAVEEYGKEAAEAIFFFTRK